MTPDEQKLKKILDYAFPITIEHRRCNNKMNKVKAQREELKSLIEAYKRGETPVVSPLVIKLDLDRIKQMINN